MPHELVYDLTGLKFNLLTVIKKLDYKDKYGNILWECVCDCGKPRISTTGNLRHEGHKSCGCKFGGRTHGDWNLRIRRIWMNMMARCYKKENPNYKGYGAKGIIVCSEWHDYAVFKKWAYENGYDDALSLDRFPNNTGIYQPDNCRWATSTEQARNKTNNKFLEFNGLFKTVAEWAEIYGIDQTRVNRRLYKGWTIEDALTKPIDQNKISKIYRHATLS